MVSGTNKKNTNVEIDNIPNIILGIGAHMSFKAPPMIGQTHTKIPESELLKPKACCRNAVGKSSGEYT